MAIKITKFFMWIFTVLIAIMYSISAVYKGVFYRILYRDSFITVRLFHIPVIYAVVVGIVLIMAFKRKRRVNYYKYVAFIVSVLYIVFFSVLLFVPYSKVTDVCIMPNLQQTDLIDYVHPKEYSLFEIVWKDNKEINLKDTIFQITVMGDDDGKTMQSVVIPPDRIYPTQSSKEEGTKTEINAYDLLPDIDYFYQYHIYLTQLIDNKAETESVADYNNVEYLNRFFYRGEFANEYYKFLPYSILRVLFLIMIILIALLYSKYVKILCKKKIR